MGHKITRRLSIVESVALMHANPFQKALLPTEWTFYEPCWREVFILYKGCSEVGTYILGVAPNKCLYDLHSHPLASPHSDPSCMFRMEARPIVPVKRGVQLISLRKIPLLFGRCVSTLFCLTLRLLGMLSRSKSIVGLSIASYLEFPGITYKGRHGLD